MEEKENLINKLERGRAEFAYKCVKCVLNKGLDEKEDKRKKEDDRIKKEYRSYVRKIPQMILSNGLAQTLAFVKAKSNDDVYKTIYTQITKYLKSESTARIRMEENKELIEWVISLDSTEYIHATEEILAFLSWLKRFAEGMIETEEGE